MFSACDVEILAISDNAAIFLGCTLLLKGYPPSRIGFKTCIASNHGNPGLAVSTDPQYLGFAAGWARELIIATKLHNRQPA